jgi:hypothetical protein
MSTESPRTGARFPVLGGRDDVERGEEYPSSISWVFVEPFAMQAQNNHAQSLYELAERGGLSAQEIWCIAHGLGLREGFKRCTSKQAIAWLKACCADAEWRVR